MENVVKSYIIIFPFIFDFTIVKLSKNTEVRKNLNRKLLLIKWQSQNSVSILMTLVVNLYIHTITCKIMIYCDV